MPEETTELLAKLCETRYFLNSAIELIDGAIEEVMIGDDSGEYAANVESAQLEAREAVERLDELAGGEAEDEGDGEDADAA